MLRVPRRQREFLTEILTTIFREKTVSGWRPLSPCVLAVLFLAVPAWCLSLP